MWKKAIKKEVEENTYLIDSLQDEFIKSRVKVCLEWYIAKAVRNKYYFYTLSSLAIVAPVVAEIILLCPMNQCYMKIIAGIFMGISSVAAAFLSLFEVRNKWRIYRNQAEIIKATLSMKRGVEQVPENMLLEELENGMAETHGMWMEIFKKGKKED